MRTIPFLFLFLLMFSTALSAMAQTNDEFVGQIQMILSARDIKFTTTRSDIREGDLLAVVDMDNASETLAYFRVTHINYSFSMAEGTATILKSLDNLLIKPSDYLVKVDISSSNSALHAHNQLILKEGSAGNVSSRYKPLFTQGLGIGETAETLETNEFYFTWYGQFGFGVFRRLTLSTNTVLDVLGGSNAQAKIKFWDTENTSLSFGLTYTKVPHEDKKTMNLDFYWDTISNSTTTTHTFVTLAVASFDESQKGTALKSFGTTAFQTGYEFLMSNWTRVLVGPSFNFEKKAMGGYVSWVKIWDRFHLHLSLGSTNISSMKLSFEDGYYAFFDAYWRY